MTTTGDREELLQFEGESVLCHVVTNMDDEHEAPAALHRGLCAICGCERVRWTFARK